MKKLLIIAVLVLFGSIGCKNSTVSESDPLVLNLVPTHVSVFGGADGSIDLTVSGGTNPFQYQWSNGETTEDINNLIAGTYSVTVIDAGTETITDSIMITQPNETGIVTDIDGNVYQIVKIGNQWWMAENLKTLHAGGGSVLGGVYAYNNNENYVAEDGGLYTWQAALDAELQGWHLPSDEEWYELETELGSVPGTKLKVGGSSGFNGKLVGRRTYEGGYVNKNGEFWSSTVTEFADDHSWTRVLFSDREDLVRLGYGKVGAISVRYVKD